MKKQIQRGYYSGIFFEFVLQDRLADAVIILPGFPSGNDFNDLIGLFFEKGYHVFVPRYRGTYQSLGVFLSKNPVDDLISFVQSLDEGEAKSLWDGKKLGFRINKKILVSGSFGGAIALGLAAKHPAFSHIILQAPIWDFRVHNAENNEQDLEKAAEFVKKAYKNCYRFIFKNFKRKLNKFEELKPDYYMPKLENMPVLVMHDPNDRFVAFRHTEEMLGQLPRRTYLEHLLGHKLTRDLLITYWKEIDKFIKINYVNSGEIKGKEDAKSK